METRPEKSSGYDTVTYQAAESPKAFESTCYRIPWENLVLLSQTWIQTHGGGGSMALAEPYAFLMCTLLLQGFRDAVNSGSRIQRPHNNYPKHAQFSGDER